MLLGVAQAAAARPVGALAFDSNRCDQGGHPGDSTAPNYSPCQESIFRVNADGSGLTRLTNPTNYSGPEPGADFSPSWSPDGARIVFMHTDMRGNYPGNQGWPVDLTIMNADGSGAHGIFTGSSLVDPAWSPHGDAIAFSQPIWGVGDQLKLVHTDGSHEQALTPQDFLWF